MMPRSKDQSGPPHRPEGPWFMGAMIGLAVGTLATGAMMLGASLAVGQAMIRGK